MSFLSVLGKIGGGIGKAALGVVGTTVGIDGLSTVFDKKKVQGNTPVIQAAASLIVTPTNQSGQNLGGGSLLGNINGFLGSVTSFIRGGANVNVHTSIGDSNNPNTGGLPSWLIWVGGGLLLFIVLKSSGGSSHARRY